MKYYFITILLEFGTFDENTIRKYLHCFFFSSITYTYYYSLVISFNVFPCTGFNIEFSRDVPIGRRYVIIIIDTRISFVFSHCLFHWRFFLFPTRISYRKKNNTNPAIIWNLLERFNNNKCATFSVILLDRRRLFCSRFFSFIIETISSTNSFKIQ